LYTTVLLVPVKALPLATEPFALVIVKLTFTLAIGAPFEVTVAETNTH
jgi:hypothetical protein